MELLLPKLGLIVWTLIAFGIVFFILKKYAWKPILNSLKEREKNITDSILSAENVRKEMSELKSENEALLTQAREERAQMMREAKEIRDKIIMDAKEPVSYTHLRAHETDSYLVCRLLLEKKKKTIKPPKNVTGIAKAERDMIRAWLRQ